MARETRKYVLSKTQQQAVAARNAMLTHYMALINVMQNEKGMLINNIAEELGLDTKNNDYVFNSDDMSFTRKEKKNGSDTKARARGRGGNNPKKKRRKAKDSS